MRTLDFVDGRLDYWELVPHVSEVTTERTVTDIENASHLIKIPKFWTTETMARDEGGLPIRPTDGDARSWCAQGALHKVCGRGSDVYGTKRYARRAMALGVVESYIKSLGSQEINLTWINDTRGRERVLEIMDGARKWLLGRVVDATAGL